MPGRICSLHLLRLSLAILASFFADFAQAHQVPSLGLEVDLHRNAPSTIKLDIDPRLVVSSNPTQLPPIPADWYRSLNEADRQQTFESAVRFISGNLVFKSGQEPIMLEWKFTAVDGASAVPLNDESKEIHLLAQATLQLPGPDFVVSLSNSCASALTMLAAVDDTPERRPQVLFPGETSRPIKLVKDLAEPKVEPMPQPTAPTTQAAASPTSQSPTEQITPRYWEPFKLGLLHPFHSEDVNVVSSQGSFSMWMSIWIGFGHFIFATGIALLAGNLSRAIQAVLFFHVTHFGLTLLLAQTGSVMPMPDFVWMLMVILLAFLVWKKPALAFPALAIAALIHNLDEWPHAAGIPVLSMIELGFLVFGMALQLAMSAVVIAILKLRSGK